MSMLSVFKAKLLLYHRSVGFRYEPAGVNRTLLWYDIGYAVWLDFAAWQAVFRRASTIMSR